MFAKGPHFYAQKKCIFYLQKSHIFTGNILTKPHSTSLVHQRAERQLLRHYYYYMYSALLYNVGLLKA